MTGAFIPSSAQIFPPAIGGPLNAPKAVAVVREVSAFEEGEASLIFPAAISAETVSEIEAWLNLVVKKLKRRYASETE